MHDVIVVGGGVIGLSIAQELARSRKSVLVIDRGGAGDAASWAAAGMLAPYSESEEPDPFFRLCACSLRMYSAWSDGIRENSGIDPEYTESGLVTLAASDVEMNVLRRRLEWQRSNGCAGELLTPADVRSMEPQITLPMSGGVFIRNEHHIVPRRLLKALIASCMALGVQIRTGERVHEILHSGNRVEGVRVNGGRAPAKSIVISSGAWSSEIVGLRPHLPVLPRKGQILSLSTRRHEFTRMVRWRNVYFVPRRDGELIVGATNENAGFDRALTPAGIGSLLSDAQELSSHTAGFPIAEMWAGLRPATPDGFPVMGQADLDGLLYATGHYRNGILLAPVTASIIAALMDGQVPDLPIDGFAPGRFRQ